MTNLDIYQRTDNRWAWRLLADNGQVIATDGGQGYENRGDCARIAEAVVRGDYTPTPDLLPAELAPNGRVITCPECGETMSHDGPATIEHANDGAHIFSPRLG